MQHLDEGLIHAWIDGGLPPDEAARVEQHAASCAECGAMVADARGLIAGAARIVSSLDVVRGGVVPTPVAVPRSLWSRLHFTPARAALAASLLIAASSLMVVRHAPRNVSNVVPNVPVAESVAPVAQSQPTPASMAASPKSIVPASPSATTDVAAKATAEPKTAAPMRARSALDASRVAADSNRIVRDSTAAANSAASIVATSVASADRAENKPRRFSPDSLKPHDTNPAGALPMTARRGRILQLQEVVTASPVGAVRAPMANGKLASCYELAADTLLGVRGFPKRFALLDIFAADSVRDSVHDSVRDGARDINAVADDGRVVAPPIVGSSWQRLAASAATVTFAGAGVSQPISMIITAGAPNALATSAGQSRQIGIRSIACFTP